MSILRKVNVALSNLRNAHVTLSILRNAHVPCHYLFKAHVPCHTPRRSDCKQIVIILESETGASLCPMSLSPKKAHVAVSILGVKGHHCWKEKSGQVLWCHDGSTLRTTVSLHSLHILHWRMNYFLRYIQYKLTHDFIFNHILIVEDVDKLS